MEHVGSPIIPELASKRMKEDHLSRYRFAANFVKNKNVLDMACGVGYGSKLLKEAGAIHVDGVDISEEAIKYAKSNYSIEGVNFFVSDAVKYASVKKYDFVVSFEGIEFFGDLKGSLYNFYNLLNNGGILILSTLNRIVADPYLKNPDLKSIPNRSGFTEEELLKCIIDCKFIVEGVFGQRQRVYFRNKYLRQLYKMIFNPDVKASPVVEEIVKTPRFLVIKAKKSLDHGQ